MSGDARVVSARGLPSTGNYQVPKPTLIDVPVSNHGARVRHVIYHKGIEEDFDVVPPKALGGIGSEQYKSVNPENKMPILVLPNGTALIESEVIVQYILDKWSYAGPSMMAATPELRAVANLAARIHDQYITPIQGCLYRKFDAAERAAMLEQLVKQMDVLEGLCVGPYVAGESITAGDSALVGTFVFFTFTLERYFGWPDVFAGRPKLATWWKLMQQDPAAKRVIEEVTGGLEGWASRNRWDDLGITAQLKQHQELKWVYP
eukprot:gene11007-11161_t